MASHEPNTRTIVIDGQKIQVPQRHRSGEELRNLISPAAEHIWLDVPDAQDHPMADTETLALSDGMRFFTDRPRTIFIDKVPYQVRSASLTEQQLRNLPTTPVPDDHGIWQDIPDALDDPIHVGEIVSVAAGDRFFTRPLPMHDISVVVNNVPVTLRGTRQTGASVKAAAIAHGLPIQQDFLLSIKDGKKYRTVNDDAHIRVQAGDEFRALDGDDNS
ncbi:multiubiquitin domain-containing protein [Clavibacter michiganensis]|uniref:multiubiquitin domain-containing protein n=1 Tax=Clavibacter michiganensis TaxID=28447 RepID=UPI0026DD9A50|nr:multiubiquitin domain-containing protein [Clavibacter michiganensis]MDO4144210.1 multiubiquitin domain-containing protein [Clavibacter michiganensis]